MIHQQIIRFTYALIHQRGLLCMRADKHMLFDFTIASSPELSSNAEHSKGLRSEKGTEEK
jgi:hypothetical protein